MSSLIPNFENDPLTQRLIESTANCFAQIQISRAFSHGIIELQPCFSNFQHVTEKRRLRRILSQQHVHIIHRMEETIAKLLTALLLDVENFSGFEADAEGLTRVRG